MRMQASVLVIGSGVAGLSAAKRLHESGWQNVKVFEARSFVGGRTHTLPYDSGGIELGAQWIHGQSDNVVYELANSRGLVDHEAPNFLSSISNFPQLKCQKEKEAAEDVCLFFKSLLERCQEGDIPQSDASKSLGEILWRGFCQYLTESKDSPKLLRLKEAVFDWNVRFELHINGCQTLHNVSARLLSTYETCNGNPTVEIRNNYSDIVRLLKDSVPSEWFLLDSEVKKIICNSDTNQSPIEITTAAQKRFKADHVIVTVPLGYLKHNLDMFEPSLPTKKQRAIQEVGFGTVNKIFLHYENPFWTEGETFNVLWLDGKNYVGNEFSTTDNSGFRTWSGQARKAVPWQRSLFYFTYVRNQQHLLCAWLSGEGASEMEKVSEKEVLQECHEILVATLGKPFLPLPKHLKRSSWYSDPYFKGSYSYLSTGCESANLLPKDLAEPILGQRNDSLVYPLVLFAGEATHSRFYSTVHGAYETGVREADRLITFYRDRENRKGPVPVAGQLKGGKVVIVGAGAAGLAAAQKLTSEFGFTDVMVLEAHDRIGGRILTMPLGSGVLELGAQWVHGEEGNPLFSYAQERKLLSDPKADYSLEGTGHFLDSRGLPLDRELVDQVIMALDNIKEELECHRTNTKSVGSFYRQRFHRYLTQCRDTCDIRDIKQGLYDWYVRFEVIDNSCLSLDNLSVEGFCEWMDCPGVPLINFKNGFHSLLNSLNRTLPDNCVRTGRPVKCIEWKRGGGGYPALVHCQNGETYPADHVIVTASLGFLKRHWQNFFCPSPPPSRRCVLDNFGYGTVDKMYLVFDQPFWDEKDIGFQLIWTPNQPVALTKLLEQHTWVRDISGFDIVRGQKHVLVGWIGGAGAEIAEKIPDCVVANGCIQLLRIFTANPKIPFPIQIIRSKWHEDPYIVGSYSHRLNGYKQLETGLLSCPLNSKMDTKPCEPWPVVLFAGEATDRHFFSSVHGALRSGWREAERIHHFWSETSAKQFASASIKPKL